MPLQAAVKYSATLIISNLQIAEYLLATISNCVKSQNEFIMSSIKAHIIPIYNITTHQKSIYTSSKTSL